MTLPLLISRRNLVHPFTVTPTSTTQSIIVRRLLSSLLFTFKGIFTALLGAFWTPTLTPIIPLILGKPFGVETKPVLHIIGVTLQSSSVKELRCNGFRLYCRQLIGDVSVKMCIIVGLSYLTILTRAFLQSLKKTRCFVDENIDNPLAW